MPTLETISEVYPLGVRQDELDRTSRVDLESCSSVLATILSLVLVQLHQPPSAVTRVGFQELQLDLVWLLETVTRVWGLLVPDIQCIGEKQFKGTDHVLHLNVLRQILQFVVHYKAHRVVVSQAAMLLCQSLEYHLNPSHGNATISVQKAICWCILDLYSMSIESVTVSDAFYCYLKPVIHDNMEILDRKEFCIDLQVSSSQHSHIMG